MNSINDSLREENRVMREALTQMLRYPPHFAYASAMSHPDTNTAHQLYGMAQRALRDVDAVAHQEVIASE